VHLMISLTPHVGSEDVQQFSIQIFERSLVGRGQVLASCLVGRGSIRPNLSGLRFGFAAVSGAHVAELKIMHSSVCGKKRNIFVHTQPLVQTPHDI
jgi:hypothetical protein